MTSHLLGDIPGILPEEGPGSSTVGCLFIGKFMGGIYALAEIMHQFDVETPRPRYGNKGGVVIVTMVTVHRSPESSVYFSHPRVVPAYWLCHIVRDAK